MTQTKETKPRRNRAYLRTHDEIVATAVELLAEKGEQALSIAELARKLDVNRATIYYHFENREALVRAVMAWSTQQLTTAFGVQKPEAVQAGFINRFVLDNPELIKLWIDRFVTASDIRESYPNWDQLLVSAGDHLARTHPGEEVDLEVFCVILVVSGIIGPRILHNSVAAGSSIDTVAGRFRKEINRILRLPDLP